VVDITDYDQVLAACQGMDAAIDLSVLRPHPVLAFHVNMVGAYNVAKACAACGVKRLIHTGPFHTALNFNADYWHDFQLYDGIRWAYYAGLCRARGVGGLDLYLYEF